MRLGFSPARGGSARAAVGTVSISAFLLRLVTDKSDGSRKNLHFCCVAWSARQSGTFAAYLAASDCAAYCAASDVVCRWPAKPSCAARGAGYASAKTAVDGWLR